MAKVQSGSEFEVISFEKQARLPSQSGLPGHRVTLQTTESELLGYLERKAGDELARFVAGKNLPHLRAWVNGLTDAGVRSGLLTGIGNWSDDLLARLDQALGNRPGLGAELAAESQLLRYFEGAHQNWWYKYGLLREHYRTGQGSITLPDNLRGVVEELATLHGNRSIRQGLQAAAGNESMEQLLGNMFEADLLPEVGRGFETGNFSHFPPQLQSQLQSYYSQGYEIMVTQANVQIPAGGTPRPDMLLFRRRANGTIDFDNVIAIDVKLNADYGYEAADPQRLLAQLRGSANRSTILPFERGNTARVYFPPNSRFILANFENQRITLQSFAKVGTKLDNAIYTIIYKDYNPR